MNKYWDDIFDYLNRIAPQYYIEKMICTEQDLVNTPPGTRIGDIILIPNPQFQFKARENEAAC
jgi:hypothetical protein